MGETWEQAKQEIAALKEENQRLRSELAELDKRFEQLDEELEAANKTIQFYRSRTYRVAEIEAMEKALQEVADTSQMLQAAAKYGPGYVAGVTEKAGIAQRALDKVEALRRQANG